MKLTVPLQNATMHTSNPIIVMLDDKGGAFVSLTLAIGDIKPIKHDESFDGSRKTTFSVNKGTYDCTAVISAYRSGSLGPSYDSRILINGNYVVSASGAVPQTANSDHGFVHFTLVVS